MRPIDSYKAPDEVRFAILRNKNGNYPIYSDYTHNRQKKATILKHYRGDIVVPHSFLFLFPQQLKAELLKSLGERTKIQEKVGRLEIKGLRTKEVKQWLEKLGF